jgi:hypothetical protein
MSKSIQAGWVLANRCGSENILTANKLFANAELAAFNLEIGLRQDGKKMPPCLRVITVHPDGFVADTRTPTPKLTLEQIGVTHD